LKAIKAIKAIKRQTNCPPNLVGVPRAERHLVSTLIAALQRDRKPGHRVVVSSEVDCFQGVADVVAGIYNGYRLFRNQKQSKLSTVSFSTAKVLSALAGRRTSSIGKISQISGLSSSTVKKQLTVLHGLGILRVEKGARISIKHQIRTPFQEILAFEVKVKDWKSGIYQARNYKSFAHKVSVALPLNRARLLKKRMRDFRLMRVGLLGIAPSGELEWLLRPRRQKPISGPRNFLAAITLLKNASTTS
jgi:hypothetical protein